MTALYIFGGLIVVSLIALIVYKSKASRAGQNELRLREANIERERLEEAARAAAREKS